MRVPEVLVVAVKVLTEPAVAVVVAALPLPAAATPDRRTSDNELLYPDAKGRIKNGYART